MTHHLDVALRHDLIVRWCMLAEQRLQHLTELFESGRWRRYHSERAFLENIREAKRAVEAWRILSGRSSPRKDEAPRFVRQERGYEALPLASAPSIASATAADFVPAEEVPAVPIIDLVALERALIAPSPPRLDLAAIEQRYPLLRNAL
ncbi:TIGR03809 family protein [Bradyrhizobium sp. STM 3562]|uniref:TIGR03809 family protein n=1 Tax=Bradyrhizobium sp. STM 3562 TaxID=578924 RepID=UPI00388E3C28